MYVQHEEGRNCASFRCTRTPSRVYKYSTCRHTDEYHRKMHCQTANVSASSLLHLSQTRHTETPRNTQKHTHTHKHTQTQTLSLSLSLSLSLFIYLSLQCTHKLSLSHTHSHSNAHTKEIIILRKARVRPEPIEKPECVPNQLFSSPQCYCAVHRARQEPVRSRVV